MHFNRGVGADESVSQPIFDLQSGTRAPKNSREAAEECSPGRSPGYESGKSASPKGRKIGCERNSDVLICPAEQSSAEPVSLRLTTQTGTSGSTHSVKHTQQVK